ncbi:CHY zinc finger [Bacillus sp. THAF10]|uniref:CHY zinc finger protein n=1 Tax=Bacillus sp. THAF10 TaxID=2587848 RepID=UPI001268897F|nr:CHY zinc finger protein [Bacillus sp. THAF10]QFT88458.1 CHY zinc finger [Bacillus sp. THAF10]
MSIKVFGSTIDHETRCTHYHSKKDIIAIKFYCCGEYYPCYQCHDEHADHLTTVWPKQEFHRKAILCGCCKTEMSIEEYKECDSVCPFCKEAFNPGCQLHAHLYFEV